MSDGRLYEWGAETELKGTASKFCPVPYDLIINKELYDQRITLFCYLFMRKGADNLIMFSNSNLHQWCNKKTDTHKNGVTTKFNKLMNDFERLKYISIKMASKYSCTEIEFTYEKANHFSMLWLDEIEVILENEKIRNGIFKKRNGVWRLRAHYNGNNIFDNRKDRRVYLRSFHIISNIYQRTQEPLCSLPLS